MAVSNGSVVHYTKSFETLCSILESKSFWLQYCLETKNIIESDETCEELEIAVPMVSFCDIPFTQIKEHANKYGFYGIGLSKNWAIKRCLNPVVYLADNSWLKGSLISLENKIEIVREKLLETLIEHNSANDKIMMSNQVNRLFDQICDEVDKLYCCIKPVSGDLKNIKNYDFYNEREWRFIAFIGDGLEHTISKNIYQKKKDAINKKAKQTTLEFDFNDITYIILKNDNEILQLIKFLESLDGINENLLKMTTTKIITLEQIERDF